MPVPRGANGAVPSGLEFPDSSPPSSAMTDFTHDSMENLLPIREVVRLTGVNPVTLRAWERRYGLVSPLRTEGGHRLYSKQDLQTIQDILLWTGRGLAVGKIGDMLKQRQHDASVPLHDSDQRLWWRDAFAQATAAFDHAELERLFGQVITLYPLVTAFEDILLPLWRTMMPLGVFGARSRWLFLDTFLRTRVLLRLQMNRTATAPVLFADASGNGPELELTSAALLVADDAFGVQALAPEQPWEELPLLCEAIQPAALVLLAHAPLVGESLKRLKRLQMGIVCPLAIAGEAAETITTSLPSTPIACLGSGALTMQPRLRALVQGSLQL